MCASGGPFVVSSVGESVRGATPVPSGTCYMRNGEAEISSCADLFLQTCIHKIPKEILLVLRTAVALELGN